MEEILGVGHEMTTQHDGVVPLSDCRWWQAVATTYELDRNHADFSCRTHDDTVCTLYGLPFPRENT